MGKITPKLMPIVAAALVATACQRNEPTSMASSEEEYARFCATQAADGTIVRAPDNECQTTTHSSGIGSNFFLWYLLATRHGGLAPSFGASFNSGSRAVPANGAIYDAPAPGQSMRSGAAVRSSPSVGAKVSSPGDSTRGGFGTTGSSKGSSAGSS